MAGCARPGTTSAPEAPEEDPNPNLLAVSVPAYAVRAGTTTPAGSELRLIDGRADLGGAHWFGHATDRSQELEWILPSPLLADGVRVAWRSMAEVPRRLRVLLGDDQRQFSAMLEGSDMAGWIEPGPQEPREDGSVVMELSFTRSATSRVRLIQDEGAGGAQSPNVFAPLEWEIHPDGIEEWPRAWVRTSDGPRDPWGWAAQDGVRLTGLSMPAGGCLGGTLATESPVQQVAAEFAQLGSLGDSQTFYRLLHEGTFRVLRGDGWETVSVQPVVHLGNRGTAAGIVRVVWRLEDLLSVDGMEFCAGPLADDELRLLEFGAWASPSEASEEERTLAQLEAVHTARSGRPSLLGLPRDLHESAVLSDGSIVWRPASSPALGRFGGSDSYFGLLAFGVDGVPLRGLSTPVEIQELASGGPSVVWSAQAADVRVSAHVMVSPVPPGDEGTIVVELELENLSAEPRNGHLDLSLVLADSGQPLGARWFEIQDQERTLISMGGNRVLLDLPADARPGGASLFPELPVRLPYALIGGDVQQLELRIPRSDISQERQLRSRVVDADGLRDSARDVWARALQAPTSIRLPSGDEGTVRRSLQTLLLHQDLGSLSPRLFLEPGSDLDPVLLRNILVALAQWGLNDTAQYLYDQSLGESSVEARASDPLLFRLVSLEAMAAIAALGDTSTWLEGKAGTLERATASLERLRQPLGAQPEAPGRLLASGSYELVHDQWLVRALSGLGDLSARLGFAERSRALLASADAHEALVRDAGLAVPGGLMDPALAEEGLPDTGAEPDAHASSSLAAGRVLDDLRSQLVRLSGEELALLPGVPEEWFAPGASNLLVEGLPTRLGQVSLFLRAPEGERFSMDVRYRASTPAASRIRVRVPPGRYDVDGQRVRASDGWLELPPGRSSYHISQR